MLESIKQPGDLRQLSGDQLTELAAEIRDFLVRAVAVRGGHLGPNLGVVELTIALHRALDSPVDRIVWDTGHQAYVHKLLTGRQDDFAGLRTHGGLSGYPSRAESPHDVIENSHASTALGYALGLAEARRAGKGEGRVVAVVGEGMVEAAKRVKEGAKALVAPRVVFEDLGWQYAGPVDGHDLAALEKAIDHCKRVPGPVLLHVITQKGRGYPPAEQHEEDNLHSLGAFDPETGRALPKSGDEVQFTEVFGQALLDEARRHPELVAISAAMLGPTKLTVMQSEFPERVFDVGIAEQVGVTMAAGLALQGLRPVCAIYSTFLQRAFDQVMMDVALHKLPVIFVLDRSGITGEDGSSHHGVYDVTWLREIPNLVIASPRDGNELRRALATAVAHTAGPFAIRFPRSTTPRLTVSGPVRKMKLGAWDVRARGRDVLLLGLGKLAVTCEEATRLLKQDGISVTLADPRWVKPLDPRLGAVAGAHRLVATVEDNVLAGGFGSAVAEVLADEEVATPLLRLGIPDQFLPHGKREVLLAELGLDAVGIAERVRKALHRLQS